MIRRWTIIMLLAGLGVCSCNMQGKSAACEKHVVRKSSFPVYLYCQGQIAPLLSKQFKAEKKGAIQFVIPLDESIEYREGTMIASITPFGGDLRDVNVELRSQQKELALFKKEISLQEQLFAKGQISQNELERNRIALTRKRQEVNLAGKKRGVQVLAAPFRGHLSLVLHPDGAEVSEGADVFTWMDWRTLRIKMDIPDYYLKKISRGKTVVVEGYMLRNPIRCAVAAISSNPFDNSGMNPPMGATGSNAMAAAYLPIDTADLPAISFPRGEVVCKYLDTALTDALCVPVGFLHFRGNRVFLKKSGARLLPVELGVVGDSLAEIKSGIAENDTVIRSVSIDDEIHQ